MCDDVAEVTGLIDTAGNSFTLPSRPVTCVNSICTTDGVDTDGNDYYFSAPPQTMSCTAGVCSMPAMFLNTNQYEYLNIPSLEVGMLGATAGSLYAVCMYHLDH